MAELTFQLNIGIKAVFEKQSTIPANILHKSTFSIWHTLSYPLIIEPEPTDEFRQKASCTLFT